jgi:hypothetical protein
MSFRLGTVVNDRGRLVIDIEQPEKAWHYEPYQIALILASKVNPVTVDFA